MMQLSTIIFYLFLSLTSMAFLGCSALLTTVKSFRSVERSIYILPQGDLQRTTINDIVLEVETLDRTKMGYYPDFFAFEPSTLHGYPKAYVNLYYYYPYSGGVSWAYIFGNPDGTFNFPAFLVTIKNNSNHILNLRNTYIFLTIDNSYNVVPVSNVNHLKQILREMETAFQQRPSTSSIFLRREYPIGVLSQLVDLKRPFLQFFDPRSLVLPGQEYTFLLVFPLDVPGSATLSFVGIPTKFNAAGEIIQKNNFHFSITKKEVTTAREQ